MYKVLIVDEDKSRREQVREMLGQMALEIREALFASEALELLSHFSSDILLLDVSLAEPLVTQVRERFPSLPVVLFCSHEDYPKAELQEHHGQVYIFVRPVDGREFSAFLKRILESQASRDEDKAAADGRDRHYLQEFLYSRREEPLAGAGIFRWDGWHRAILIQSAQPFFDQPQDEFVSRLERELHRPFFYLNLDSYQSLLFFREVYCDYNLIGKHIYIYLKRRNASRFYLAVSRQFSSHRELPEVLFGLEQEMEERFYQPDTHIFTSEEEKEKYVTEETQDSQLINRISEDIGRKDVALLKKHFGILVEKYQKQTQFSAMYVKFVFSNVLQELFQDSQFARERALDKQIDLLYSYSDMGRILEITRQEIAEYELFLERCMAQSKKNVEAVCQYVQRRPEELLTLEELAGKVGLTPSYLNFMFRRETGMSLARYQHVCRMKKAAQLLRDSTVSATAVGSLVGFESTSYFASSFADYYSRRPEEYRAGLPSGMM